MPLTQRGSDYHLVSPDRITMFRGPAGARVQSPQAIAREVRITVLHELGHHLGFDEEQLNPWGWDSPARMRKRPLPNLNELSTFSSKLKEY